MIHLLAVVLLATPADKAGTSDPALFPRVAGFRISDYKDTALDALVLKRKEAPQIELEGRVQKWTYLLDRDLANAGKAPSRLAVIRQLLEAGTKSGGKVIFETPASENPTRAILQKKDGKKTTFIEIEVLNMSDEYYVTIVDASKIAGPFEIGGSARFEPATTAIAGHLDQMTALLDELEAATGAKPGAKDPSREKALEVAAKIEVLSEKIDDAFAKALTSLAATQSDLDDAAARLDRVVEESGKKADKSVRGADVKLLVRDGLARQGLSSSLPDVTRARELSANLRIARRSSLDAAVIAELLQDLLRGNPMDRMQEAVRIMTNHLREMHEMSKSIIQNMRA